MAQTLDDAHVELTTELGSHREVASARAWHGTVLVEWQRDDTAGGCLLRPDLVRRLLALNAAVTAAPGRITITATARIVAALSPSHARLAAQLGPTMVLRLALGFDGPRALYLGGEETYTVARSRSRTGASGTILRLQARVRPPPAGPESPRTSPEPS